MKIDLKQMKGNSLKAVSCADTFEYGAPDRLKGYGMSIVNGRLVERNNRAKIFRKKCKIVKISRLTLRWNKITKNQD